MEDLDQLIVLVRQSIGAYLRSTDRPMTFWLGAGASVSSGGPSTWKAIEALERQAGGRGSLESSGGITAQFDQWNPSEKRAALSPLFDGFKPYLGYRLLASLGRTRKIRVINLNWDPAVQWACDLLGVSCHSFDLNSLTAADEALCRDPGPGVVVAHVHGKLEEDPRYALLATLKFGQAQEELLGQEFLPHTTVTIGARFDGDTDVTNFLAQQASRSAEHPVFVFARGPMYEPGHNILRWMNARNSVKNLRLNEAVDFDRIMLELTQSLTGRYFDEVRDLCPALVIPKANELVMPHPDTFRARLDDPVIALIGSPQKGKTTAAALLVHIAALAAKDAEASYAPKLAMGGIEAAAALADSERGPVLIDDPFGAVEGDYVSNTALYKQLGALSSSKGHWLPTVVASRRSPWLRAVDQDRTDKGNSAGPQLELIDVDAAALFSSGELKLVLRPGESAIEKAIDSAVLTSPHEIYRRRNGLPAGGESGADAIAALNQRPETALLLALARLQYLTDKPKPLTELTELSKQIDPAFGGDSETSWAWALSPFTLDERRFVRPSHSVYVEAVDHLLARTSSPLAAAVTQLCKSTPWLREALAIHSIAIGAVDQLEPLLQGLDPTLRGEWLPTLVAAHPGRVLRLIQDRWYPELDRWGVCELALNLLAAWPGPSESASLTMISRIGADREREGVYALVEAACYLGSATPQPIADRIRAWLWDLLSPSSQRLGEAAKCYDALLWKRSLLPVADEWFADFLRAAVGEPQVLGAVLAANAYHPSSVGVLQAVGSADRLANPDLQLASAEVSGAVQMIRWHYAHNARSSAIMLRHERVDLDALRRRAPIGSREVNPRAARMLEALSRHPEARGWAAVAALQMAAAGSATDGDNPWAVRAISEATAQDEGLIAALVSFEISGPLVAACKAWTALPEVRAAFLDALSNGLPASTWTGMIELPETVEDLAPPRFRIVRDGPHQLRTLGITFPALEALGIPFSSRPEQVLKGLEQHRAAASARYGTRIVDRIIESAAAGDARPLAAAASARSTSAAAAAQKVALLLDRAAALQSAPGPAGLFELRAEDPQDPSGTA